MGKGAQSKASNEFKSEARVLLVQKGIKTYRFFLHVQSQNDTFGCLDAPHTVLPSSQ